MGFNDLKKLLIKFRNDRNWKQFHDPKNLAEAISIESGELLENFLWKTVSESQNLDERTINKIKSEVSDIINFCVYLSIELDFDLIEEAKNKITLNKEKYPKDKSFGSAKKYTEFK